MCVFFIFYFSFLHPSEETVLEVTVNGVDWLGSADIHSR